MDGNEPYTIEDNNLKEGQIAAESNPNVDNSAVDDMNDKAKAARELGTGLHRSKNSDYRRGSGQKEI